MSGKITIEIQSSAGEHNSPFGSDLVSERTQIRSVLESAIAQIGTLHPGEQPRPLVDGAGQVCGKITLGDGLLWW
jgi:hypothetical protein